MNCRSHDKSLVKEVWSVTPDYHLFNLEWSCLLSSPLRKSKRPSHTVQTFVEQSRVGTTSTVKVYFKLECLFLFSDLSFLFVRLFFVIRDVFPLYSLPDDETQISLHQLCIDEVKRKRPFDSFLNTLRVCSTGSALLPLQTRIHSYKETINAIGTMSLSLLLRS